MIIAILTFILLFILIEKADKLSLFVENLSTSLLVYLGLVGTVTFFSTEYLNVSFKNSFYLILLIVLAVTSYFYLKNKKSLNLSLKTKKENILQLLLSIFLFVMLARSLSMPVQGWDSFSLYDARAKFLTSGAKFVDFKEFSKYDNFNQFYYFSYPPMTSEIHAMIYSLGISSPMFIYSIFYWSIAVYTFLLLYKLRISSFIKVILFVVIAFNFLIISQIDSSYTNLPMTAFEIASIYYLVKYIKEKNLNTLILSALFLAFSVWTRSLELTFAGYFIGLSYVVLQNKKENWKAKSLTVSLYVFIGIILKIIWSFYIRQNIGSLPGTTIDIFSIAPKLIDSLTISNTLNVAIFVENALLDYKSYILVFILAFILELMLKNKRKLLEANILFIILVTNLLIMFLGTLYFSQTFSWWEQIPGSFTRSNLIIIPLSVLYSAYVFEGARLKKNQ